MDSLRQEMGKCIRNPRQKLMEHRRHFGSQSVICTERTNTAEPQARFKQKIL